MTILLQGHSALSSDRELFAALTMLTDHLDDAVVKDLFNDVLDQRRLVVVGYDEWRSVNDEYLHESERRHELESDVQYLEGNVAALKDQIADLERELKEARE